MTIKLISSIDTSDWDGRFPWIVETGVAEDLCADIEDIAVGDLVKISLILQPYAGETSRMERENPWAEVVSVEGDAIGIAFANRGGHAAFTHGDLTTIEPSCIWERHRFESERAQSFHRGRALHQATGGKGTDLARRRIERDATAAR